MGMGTKRKAKYLHKKYGSAAYVRIFERIANAENLQSVNHMVYWRKVLDELSKFEQYLGRKT
jgi:hypothetical protein